MKKTFLLTSVLCLVAFSLAMPAANAFKWWPSSSTPTVNKVEPVKAPSKQYRYALIETQRGSIGIELYPQDAPKTVANFVRLVERGFYNQTGMSFHRVVPGFVIQTGDPTGTGEGGSDQTIPLEVSNKLSHNAKGIIAMARTYDPNSATSQFYITLTSQRNLDGKYAVFGKVIRGLAVLDQIKQGDKVYGAKLVTEMDLPPSEPRSIFGIPFGVND